MIKLVITALFVATMAFNGIAQEKISAVVKEIEKKNTTKVIYSEKRDPQNKKVYKISKHITFYDKELKEKLQKAISEDRENSTSYKVLTNCVIIKFSDNTGENTLEIGTFLNRQAGWSIMIKKQGYKACDGSYSDWEVMIKRIFNDINPNYEAINNDTAIFVPSCAICTA